MEPIVIVSLVVTSVSLVLDILSTTMPYWWSLHVPQNDTSANLGLFELCASVNGESECFLYLGRCELVN